LEALEEKNGELTYNRFERECDWNIFERDKPDLGISVRKKWEASMKQKEAKQAELKQEMKEQMVEIITHQVSNVSRN